MRFILIIPFIVGCSLPTDIVEGDLAAGAAIAVVRNRSQPEPTPTPGPDECCSKCENGWITHGDGHRTPCPCPPECKCKR